MPERIRQKWRPPLALVIGGTLAAVLILPLLGIGYFRVAGNILGWAETSWLIGWMAVIATAILGFLLWRLVLRPVYALTAHARAVRDGNNETSLPTHFGTPEFTALGAAMDDMATTLQNREAGVRAFSDHVTHEMRSPLSSISAAAELLSEDVSDEDRTALLTSIRTSSARMETLLNALRRLTAARAPLGHGPTDLATLASALTSRSNLEVRIVADGALPLEYDGALAVLEQLAQNSADHGAQSLTLGLSGNLLRIADDGPGIEPGDQTRVFAPFFTTRRNSGGTGMGLSIARAMLEASGATITLKPSDQGAVFEITFTARR